MFSKNFLVLFKIKTKQKHIIATSEGSAVSIGIGYYLSTKNYQLYMQNSGLSNALNPLISISHKGSIFNPINFNYWLERFSKIKRDNSYIM